MPDAANKWYKPDSIKMFFNSNDGFMASLPKTTPPKISVFSSFKILECFSIIFSLILSIFLRIFVSILGSLSINSTSFANARVKILELARYFW